MLEQAQLLNEETIFVEVFSNATVQKFTVKLNTDQMKLEYVNSEGVALSDIGGSYSDFTMSVGGKSGRDNVDLYDSGEFHESFRIENITGKGFVISSDPVKDDGTNLLEEWGEEIEGLTFESLDKVADFILPIYQQKIVEWLLKNG